MLPKTIRIGAHTYDVQRVAPKKLGKEEMGETQDYLNRIRVLEDIPPTRELETFLHECLHAMLAGHEFQDEEAIVVILGEGLTSFLADNPTFVRSALRTLSDPKKTS
jgi:hypothetical protein